MQDLHAGHLSTQRPPAVTAVSVLPGTRVQVRFPVEMDLGDMFISLAYVDRQIKRDKEEEEAAAAAAATNGDGEGEEQEWWDSERGVSGAMSRVFDVQVGIWFPHLSCKGLLCRGLGGVVGVEGQMSRL